MDLLALDTAAPALHPSLWRAHQLGRVERRGWPSGFAALDAELPGGGWPAGALTELLLPHPGVGELRLLAPALAAVQRGARPVMLVAPPARPCGWAWRAMGLELSRMLVVDPSGSAAWAGSADHDGDEPGRAGSAEPGGPRPQAAQGRGRPERATAALLWALEHALRSGQLGALLAWLPARLPADALRRLQLAAQGHEGPVFLLRDLAAARQASPAALRCALQPAGPDTLELRLLKRRGPPRDDPLRLALPPVLTARACARSSARAAPVVAGREAAGRRLAASGA